MNEFESKLRNLYDWLRENGLDIEKTALKIELSDNVLEGYCLKSLKKLEPNTSIIKIPQQLLINHRFALRNKQLANFLDWYASLPHYSTSIHTEPDLAKKLTRFDSLILLILLDKHAPGSFLYRYIQTMPASFTTSEYFDSELIAMLPGYLKSTITKRQQRLNDNFKFISHLLDEYRRTVKKSQDNETLFAMVDNFTYENFRWAFCAVNTRCFCISEDDICNSQEIELGKRYFGDRLSSSNSKPTEIESLYDYKYKKEQEEISGFSDYVLAPFIDFMNHSFAFNVARKFNPNERVYEISSNNSMVTTHEQILTRYSSKDNTYYLIEWGFIDEQNPFDRFVFDVFEDVIRDMNMSADLERALINKAIDENLLDNLSCNVKEGPSSELIRFLNLLNLINKKSIDQVNGGLRNFDSNQIGSKQDREDIRELYLSLLEKCESVLSPKLFQLLDGYLIEHVTDTAKKYHAQMCLKLCKIHLDIVRFNLEMAKNSDKWSTICF